MSQVLNADHDLAAVDAVVEDVRGAIGRRQKADGHWVYELEADATIPAEYIMLNHFLGTPEPETEAKLAAYLRRIQGKHGGWPLFHDGDLNISASVKAYLALKLAGDDINAPHMTLARDAIRAHGGAAQSNVFTRIALALFGYLPWDSVPTMPVEIMLLPRWFPFHLDRVSYWSRTVIVPLLVLMALKPRAVNPKAVKIDELFMEDPFVHVPPLLNPTNSKIGRFFLGLDKVLKKIEPHFPVKAHEKAITKAMAWTTERLNGEDGLGAIFPAMANSVMAFTILGYPKDHPDLVIARKSISNLLVIGENEGYCQPCVSPIWDTGLAVQAMMEAGDATDSARVKAASDWMAKLQILDLKGDWAVKRPDLRPGGWAFQYRNDYYPDVDDTAVVAMALHRTGDERYKQNIARAAEWIIGMQSSNGGWGAFDAENEHYELNHIPFADHGALLDPPTVDVSARCLSFLAQIGFKTEHPAVRRGIEYLRKEQEQDGSWFGRWGTNYIYGTWSALCATNACGLSNDDPMVRRAVAYLLSKQNGDGGWGEDGATYWQDRRHECKASTASQTAWALLGLMAAGEIDNPAVAKGIDYLLTTERNREGRWTEDWYTAVGFPRVFYLRYHGYAAYFPLWALSRYRNMKRSNQPRVAWGM